MSLTGGDGAQRASSRLQALICAVDSDAANVYITLTARALNPKLVIVARASDPTSVDTLVRAGADRVVSPYLLSGRRMASWPSIPRWSTFLDLMSIVPDLRLEQILVQAGSVLDGTTVAAASAAYRDATILAIRRATGESIAYPGPEVDLAPATAWSCSAPCQSLMPWGAGVCPTAVAKKDLMIVEIQRRSVGRSVLWPWSGRRSCRRRQARFHLGCWSADGAGCCGRIRSRWPTNSSGGMSIASPPSTRFGSARRIQPAHPLRLPVWPGVPGVWWPTPAASHPARLWPGAISPELRRPVGPR